MLNSVALQMDVLALVMNQMDISSGTPHASVPSSPAEEDDGLPPNTPSSGLPMGKVGQFDSHWKVYTEMLALGMGLFELDSDSKLWFGNGMRDLSAMLSSEENIAETINPRQLIWSIFSLLSSSHDSLHSDTPLLCDLLHSCRAVLYLRGIDSEYPNNPLERREYIWGKFISNTPLLQVGSHLTRWTQWILAELGSAEVLSHLAGSTEACVKLANMQFGTALLAGGNKKLQNILAGVLNQGSSALFSSVVVELDEAQCELRQVINHCSILAFD